MMEQLDNLQQTVQNMQKTIDTQTAVLRTLIEQTSESVNSMKATVADLQKTHQQNLAQTSSRFEAMTGQIQALSESLDEAKSRLGKLSDQMAQTQNIITTLNNPNAAAQQPNPNQPAGAPAGAPAGPPPANNPGQTKIDVPDAESLYNSGVTYYNGGNYQLAMQAFQQYLQYYGETDRASNAQFYVGECYYSLEDYQKAVQAYDKCVERYPNGNKVAPAQLKKGYALLELGQTQAGVKELRSLVQRFPNSNEAELARQRLKRVSGSTATRRSSR